MNRIINTCMNTWWRLVRFGFRLLYNELAFVYDWVSWTVSLGQWRCWQRQGIKYLGAPKGAFVLDLAHGTGNLHLDLVAEGWKTIGFDLSSAMGRITRRKMLRQGLTPRLVRGNAMQLPFANQVFDAVISTFPTEFIVHEHTLSDVYRILKPDGHFVVVMSAVFTSGGFLTRLIEFVYRITGQRDNDPHRELTLEQVTAGYRPILMAFKSAGFAVQIHVDECPRSRVIVIDARKTPV